MLSGGEGGERGENTNTKRSQNAIESYLCKMQLWEYFEVKHYVLFSYYFNIIYCIYKHFSILEYTNCKVWHE